MSAGARLNSASRARRSAGQFARIPSGVRQVLASAAGLYVGYGAFFLFNVVTNRTLGTAALGAFTAAYAATQLGLQTLVSGTTAVHRRDVAMAPARAAALTSEHLVVRLQTLGTAGVLVVAAASVLAGAHALVFALVAAAKVADAVAELVEGTLVALGRASGAAVLQSVRLVTAFALPAIALLRGASLPEALAWYAGASVVAAAAWLLGFPRLVGALTLRWSREAALRVLREAWPLVVATAVTAGAARVTQLLVGGLAGHEVLGAYSAVLTIVFGAGMVGSAIGLVVYPRLCAAWAVSPAEMRRTVRRVFSGLAVAAIPAGIAGAALAPLVLRLFGALPAGAGLAASVAATAIAPMLVQPAYGYALTAMGRNHDVLAWSTLAFALSVGAYLVLVPTGGLVGAAVAFAASQFIAAAGPIAWVELRHFRRFATPDSPAPAEATVG